MQGSEPFSSKIVGLPGIEPGTSSVLTMRDNHLHHKPVLGLAGPMWGTVDKTTAQTQTSDHPTPSADHAETQNGRCPGRPPTQTSTLLTYARPRWPGSGPPASAPVPAGCRRKSK